MAILKSKAAADYNCCNLHHVQIKIRLSLCVTVRCPVFTCNTVWDLNIAHVLILVFLCLVLIYSEDIKKTCSKILRMSQKYSFCLTPSVYLFNWSAVVIRLRIVSKCEECGPMVTNGNNSNISKVTNTHFTTLSNVGEFMAEQSIFGQRKLQN